MRLAQFPANDLLHYFGVQWMLRIRLGFSLDIQDLAAIGLPYDYFAFIFFELLFEFRVLGGDWRHFGDRRGFVLGLCLRLGVSIGVKLLLLAHH